MICIMKHTVLHFHTHLVHILANQLFPGIFVLGAQIMRIILEDRPKELQAILSLHKHVMMWMHHDWLNWRLLSRPILTPFSIVSVPNSPITPAVTM